MPGLVLASSSPRRRDLLGQIGVVPSRIAEPLVDEAPLKGELPRDHALRLALAKAQAVARGPDEIVLAGDTCVGAGRRILPKADTPEMVRQCLELLSGRRHDVWSRSEEHTSELQSLMRISYAVFCLKKKNIINNVTSCYTD